MKINQELLDLLGASPSELVELFRESLDYSQFWECLPYHEEIEEENLEELYKAIDLGRKTEDSEWYAVWEKVQK
jgi:molybdopterin/thiamine biosynthesis adenylyltransferase